MVEIGAIPHLSVLVFVGTRIRVIALAVYVEAVVLDVHSVVFSHQQLLVHEQQVLVV